MWIIRVTLRYHIALNKNTFPIFCFFCSIYVLYIYMFCFATYNHYFEKDTNYIFRMNSVDSGSQHFKFPFNNVAASY